jgi:hypothetical protein
VRERVAEVEVCYDNDMADCNSHGPVWDLFGQNPTGVPIPESELGKVRLQFASLPCTTRKIELTVNLACLA